jgi:hypothetical protein
VGRRAVASTARPAWATSACASAARRCSRPMRRRAPPPPWFT